MRSRVLFAFFLATGILATTNSHAVPNRPNALAKQSNLRVLLGSHARATVSGYDLVLNGNIHLRGTSAFSLRCGAEPGSGAAYVEFGAGRRALGRLDIVSLGGFIQFNERPYRTKLTIIPQGTNCMVVNTLDLEKYLAGVIAREMSPSWPLEALKAQAVASRSYAFFQMQAKKTREFDVESTTQDQVYEGALSESLRSIQAVEATRNLALVYGTGALKAYFHANCGGITEVPEFVWGGEVKAFRQVTCPYHKRDRDRTRWSLQLSKLQIESALKRVNGLLPRSFRRLASLDAGAPDASQRLSDVSVSDSEGNSFLVSANSFRNAIGNTKLKSTSFQIHKDGSGYSLEGEGYGHGVGLCQVGARAMAEEGRSFMQILQFYYPLAKIRTLL